MTIKENWVDYFDPNDQIDYEEDEFNWKDWIEMHTSKKDWKDKIMPQIDDVAVKAKEMYDKLIKPKENGGTLECPAEIATDLSLLSLYNVVLLLDDSTSMEFSEKRKEINGNPAASSAADKRKHTLNMVLQHVCEVYECTRPEGVVSVKWFNDRQGRKDITKDKAENPTMKEHPCSGVTRIGTELKKKIIDQFVYKNGQDMNKPLLVIVITDGKVEGEKIGLLEHVIINCLEKCKSDDNKGENALSLQFAQVGRDLEAGNFLRKISKDKRIEKKIDCVLNASLDYMKDEDLKWQILAQLLLGAITDQWNRHNAPVIWSTDTKEQAEDNKLGEYGVDEDDLDDV